MGINKGKEYLDIARNARTNSIKELSGKKMGIDGNLLLSQLVTRDKDLLWKLYMDPVQDISWELHKMLDEKLKIWREQKIDVLFVLDGASNPRKSAEQQSRRDRRKIAQDNLKILLQKENGGNDKELISLMKQSTSIDDDILKKTLVWCDRNHIKYIQSPFESDPQLFMLEYLGLIDGIITEDTDLIYLGCKLVVVDLVYKNDVEECTCNIVKNSEVLTFLKHKWECDQYVPDFNDLAIAGTLLGSDFFKFSSDWSVGPVKVDNIMKAYIAALPHGSITTDQKVDTLIKVLEQNLQSNQNKNKWGNFNEIKDLKHGIYSLLYPTVWEIKQQLEASIP